MRWSHSLTQNLVSGCESEAHRRVSKQVSHSCSCSNFCFDSRCLHAQPCKWQLFFAVLLEILEAETRRVAEKSSAFGYLRFTASSSRRDASGCRPRCFRCEARTEDSYSKIAGCSAMGQFVEAVNQKLRGWKKQWFFGSEKARCWFDLPGRGAVPWYLDFGPSTDGGGPQDCWMSVRFVVFLFKEYRTKIATKWFEECVTDGIWRHLIAGSMIWPTFTFSQCIFYVQSPQMFTRLARALPNHLTTGTLWSCKC